MASRTREFKISRPRPIDEHTLATPAIPPTIAQAIPVPIPQAAKFRPLSDIRELSEPSIIEPFFRRPLVQPIHKHTVPQVNISQAGNSSPLSGGGSAHEPASQLTKLHVHTSTVANSSSSYSSTPEPPSSYNIAQWRVPQRSSSQTHSKRPIVHPAPDCSIRRAIPGARATKEHVFTIPNRGQSRSPVKQTGLRLDAVRSDTSRRVPSRTLIRVPPRTDILEYPLHRHPRLKLELIVNAPLFVGGGSIEGMIRVNVDWNAFTKYRRSLGIGGISVDLMGFEEVSSERRTPFLALGTELLDVNNPPPGNMVEPPNPLSPEERFWTLVPSVSSLPFMLSLPLNTGPPPFASKHANIRFLLCATALISDAGKVYEVRTSQDVKVLPTYDPEKALISLSSPLTATDTISIQHFGRCEPLQLTAGLHRQVWVSGSSVFADVHISNKTHGSIKRLELALERALLCYKHAPASMRNQSASQARIFERCEQTVAARLCMKAGDARWVGLEPYQSDSRTFELEVPRGHATIRCGKHFEVRFFLNITVSISSGKCVSVQLPIVLIHMNSLDIVPNSVAQVAAAIDEKRQQCSSRSRRRHRTHSRAPSCSSLPTCESTRKTPYNQGRAFAAPRQQSSDIRRANEAMIDNIRHIVDSSPRKFRSEFEHMACKTQVKSSSRHADITPTSTRFPLSETWTGHRPLRHLISRPLPQTTDTNANAMATNTSQQARSPDTTTNATDDDENIRPTQLMTSHDNQPCVLDPHVLGLSLLPNERMPPVNRGQSQTHNLSTTSSRIFQARNSEESRPSPSLSTRLKSHNDTVRRRGTSGSLRDKGKAWWLGQVKSRETADDRLRSHRDRHWEREGWI